MGSLIKCFYLSYGNNHKFFSSNARQKSIEYNEIWVITINSCSGQKNSRSIVKSNPNKNETDLRIKLGKSTQIHYNNFSMM